MQSVSEVPFVAGDVALDFVNTAEERGHPDAGDALVGPGDLRLWGQRYGLLAASARLGPDAAGELEESRRARDLLYDVLFARVHGQPPVPAQLTALAELGRAAYQAATLTPGDDGGVDWAWSRTDLASVRHLAVTRGLELLRTAPSPRLKQCPGDHCGWIFLDTTKRGNRRWCLMSECGQDAKDASRRTKRRVSAGPESR